MGRDMVTVIAFDATLGFKFFVMFHLVLNGFIDNWTYLNACVLNLNANRFSGIVEVAFLGYTNEAIIVT